MSKVPKDQVIEQKLQIRRRSDDKFAYRTAIISCILGIIFYITSFIFNVGLIPLFNDTNIIFTLLDILIKVISVLLFFVFMMISVGNYKELNGNPLGWKELLVLIVLSLGQSLLNLLVFSLSFIGLLIIVIYFYLVQEP